MPDISINYKGNVIASMDASGTKTLQTSGKYCEGDISVVYAKPVMACQIIEFTLASRSAQNVTIGTLSDEAYAHIDDDNFAVSMINTTPERIVNADDYRVNVYNNPNQPIFNSENVVYGNGNRKVSAATAVSNIFCYYPPKSTDNSTSLGGIGKIWHNGKTLNYKSAGYYLSAGVYRVVITW